MISSAGANGGVDAGVIGAGAVATGATTGGGATTGAGGTTGLGACATTGAATGAAGVAGVGELAGIAGAVSVSAEGFGATGAATEGGVDGTFALRSASSSSKSNTTGAVESCAWNSVSPSFLRRRRPPRRPRRRERVASSPVASAECGATGTDAFAGVDAGNGARVVTAALAAGISRFGRSAAGCWAGCGLRCWACCGFWRCASPRALSCCGRWSRRCCCLLPPSRERSRWPRESPRFSSRTLSRRCWPLPRAGFPRPAAGTSSARVFSGAAGLWNQLIMRAKKPGVGARAGEAAGSGSSRTGAGLAGTIPLTTGFSGSAPGLAICGGGTATAGVRRS